MQAGGTTGADTGKVIIMGFHSASLASCPPGAPVAPVAPVAPTAPVAPVTPCVPVFPWAPVAPVAPLGPIRSLTCSHTSPLHFQTDPLSSQKYSQLKRASLQSSRGLACAQMPDRMEVPSSPAAPVAPVAPAPPVAPDAPLAPVAPSVISVKISHARLLHL